MLIHPQFDPIIISIGGVSMHWYGLMYVLAFLQFLFLGKFLIAKKIASPKITYEVLDDLLFFGAIGVIIGGRLGEVLFYAPSYYFHNPSQIIAVWRGGMSFHGGFLGVLISVSLYLFLHNKKIPEKNLQISWLELTDFIAPLVPLGLAFGRVGNFINGELWGRVCDATLPWAMIFPQAGDDLPRHPSQLYHVALEGILLFLILWICVLLRKNKDKKAGFLSAIFLLGYGVFRFITEFFREPDVGIFGHSYVVSMGQWLSLPMILVGILLLIKIKQK